MAGAQPSRDGVTAGSVKVGAASIAIAPNPLAGGYATVRYSLPKAGLATLTVFDVTGRTVRTLASGRQKAGFYSVSWDARDSHGRQVPYGVYFYRLDTPGFRSVKKAVVAH